jgi:hypothetical protein
MSWAPACGVLCGKYTDSTRREEETQANTITHLTTLLTAPQYRDAGSLLLLLLDSTRGKKKKKKILTRKGWTRVPSAGLTLGEFFQFQFRGGHGGDGGHDMRTDLHPRPVHEDAMRARCGEGCATRPPLGRQSNGSELARLLDFWLVATMATMATLGSRPLKKNLAMVALVGSLSPHLLSLMVAMVAMPREYTENSSRQMKLPDAW